MIITAEHLITGDGSTVLDKAAVLIGKNGKIVKVGKKEELTALYPDEEVKDYGDATILPGLTDMHAHLGYWYSQPDSFNYNDQMIMMLSLIHI